MLLTALLLVRGAMVSAAGRELLPDLAKGILVLVSKRLVKRHHPTWLVGPPWLVGPGAFHRNGNVAVTPYGSIKNTPGAR